MSHSAHAPAADTAFDALVTETIALFHRLRAAAEQVHRPGKLSGARRGVLRGLDRVGPQTVPQMAQARRVSRQHIQTLVNGLEAESLVELSNNPAHKRSRLVRLTARGRQLVDAMDRRERALLARFSVGVPERSLRSAASVLRLVREALESERWTRLVRVGQVKNGAARPAEARAGGATSPYPPAYRRGRK